MAPLLMTAEFTLFGLLMFNLGLFVPVARNKWHRWRMKRERAGRGDGKTITKSDIREELCRDPVAVDMFMSEVAWVGEHTRKRPALPVPGSRAQSPVRVLIMLRCRW